MFDDGVFCVFICFGNLIQRIYIHVWRRVVTEHSLTFRGIQEYIVSCFRGWFNRAGSTILSWFSTPFREAPPVENKEEGKEGEEPKVIIFSLLVNCHQPHTQICWGSLTKIFLPHDVTGKRNLDWKYLIVQVFQQ